MTYEEKMRLLDKTFSDTDLRHVIWNAVGNATDSANELGFEFESEEYWEFAYDSIPCVEAASDGIRKDPIHAERDWEASEVADAINAVVPNTI